MKNKSLLVAGLFVAGSMLAAVQSFAGSGKVRFGAYSAGQGCTGTGICQTGSTSGGVTVTTEFYRKLDTAGGTYSRLTMIVNYENAKSEGFIGPAQGGSYTFTGGYTFNHPGDGGFGVPSSFSIPNNYKSNYGPADKNGNITLIVTQLLPNN